MLNEEQFSQAETDLLKKHFTNTDRPVFALKNLPEVVKGALFARYSRSPKSVRQLFLDEFKQQVEQGSTGIVAETAPPTRPNTPKASTTGSSSNMGTTR